MINVRTEESEIDSLLDGVESETGRRLLRAALVSFARRGFYATTTREISADAGLSPAAVYVHFSSKTELLYELSKIGHEAVLETVEREVKGGSDPQGRMRNLVSAYSRWHAEHHTLARVVEYERGALTPEWSKEIADLRLRFDAMVDRHLRAGVRARQFEVDDLKGTRRAILSLCVDVTRWYGPDERRTPTAIGDLYADLVLKMLARHDD